MSDLPLVLSCPSCAGSVSTQAQACSYCGNHLAMLRCPQCATPHFLGAKHCTQCRHVLRESPRGPAQEEVCPHCKVKLLQTRFGDNVAAGCGQCAGLFLTHDVLEDLMLARERTPAVTPRIVKPVAVPPSEVRYVRCPKCNNMMNRLNFARRSGVIVDVCSQHGTWFDAGELALALQLVARGGRLMATDLVRQEQAQAAKAQERAPVFVTAPEAPTPTLAGMLARTLGAILFSIID